VCVSQSFVEVGTGGGRYDVDSVINLDVHRPDGCLVHNVYGVSPLTH
jgi:hypothetical protein